MKGGPPHNDDRPVWYCGFGTYGYWQKNIDTNEDEWNFYSVHDKRSELEAAFWLVVLSAFLALRPFLDSFWKLVLRCLRETFASKPLARPRHSWELVLCCLRETCASKPLARP